MLPRILPILTALLVSSVPTSAAIVWATGGPGVTTVEFTKAGGADPTLVNDPISPRVILGRADQEGIYNLAAEPSFERHFSPAGTEWAFAGLFGNPATVSAADFASLNFDNFEDALGSRFALLGNIVDRPGVLHLIEEDIYLDLTFTEWGVASDLGSFAYIRTAGPVPEPSSLLLAVAGGALLLSRRRR